MQQFIARLREKPEHVRERIALMSAIGVTAVVAVGWLAAAASSGLFALQASSVAEGVAAVGAGVSQAAAGYAAVQGANGSNAANAQPAITVVNAGASASATPSTVGPTVIPF
ncbi:MAG: hypothetical protein KGI41_00230 [Patescibacteria group bacterium]|nr:hypothetical protein [Patescibacteria group bacterium]MDE1965659.1 hypothetical protein [Patescibacteria group bacterium]